MQTLNCVNCHKDSPHHKERDYKKGIWVMVCDSCGFRTESPSAYKLMGMPFASYSITEFEKLVDEAQAAKIHFLLCWLQILCRLRVMLIVKED